MESPANPVRFSQDLGNYLIKPLGNYVSAHTGLAARRDPPGAQGLRHVVELLGELLIHAVGVFQRVNVRQPAVRVRGLPGWRGEAVGERSEVQQYVWGGRGQVVTAWQVMTAEQG